LELDFCVTVSSQQSLFASCMDTLPLSGKVASAYLVEARPSALWKA
jgi:hypothetical protein